MPLISSSWPGTNRFCLGCLIAGPLADFAANSCWYGCAIITIIPISIFITPEVWKITPVLPILFYLIILLTTIFLNLTGCTDPGIIPRRPYIQRQQRKYQQGEIQYQILDNFLRKKQLLSSSLNQINQKYCQTCQIFRTPRASHCQYCDNCVQVFDHHCPFVNNCIGKRNYRFFIMFLIGVMSSISVLIVNVVIYLLGKQMDINPTVVIVIGVIAVAVVVIPVFGFFVFHVYLTVTGKTTREVVKKIDVKGDMNKIVEGYKRDVNVQWCKVDRSVIDFFQEIQEKEHQELVNKLNNMKFNGAN